MTITTPAPAAVSADGAERRRGGVWRPMAAAAAVGSVLVISGFGVWASLNAEATGVQSVKSGTLALTLASSGGGTGFTQQISDLAPGDSVSRYVILTNSGSLAGRTLSMKVAATGSSALITNGTTTKALRVTVANCAQAWSGGACGASGGAVTMLNGVVVSALATANPFTGVTGLDAAQALNLKVTVALPDQDENTVNGVVTGPSVQNAAASLTYTFAEVQRDGTAT